MISMRHLPWALALFFAVGCSLINKPDEVRPGSGSAGGSTNTGGAGPACKVDDDCKALGSDCSKAFCDPVVGTCKTLNQPEGMACGDATAGDCDAADSCDANGACKPNHAAEGTYCGDCAAGAGKCALCTMGKCNDCPTRATNKTFRTPLSTAGWKFTGGWGLFEQTPPATNQATNMPQPPVVFAEPVIGTDGNRAHPYPGREKEQSSATSPPSILPPALIFDSWSFDEGGGFNGAMTPYDQKTISVSIDGGASFTVIAFCSAMTQYDFCQPTDGQWRTITLDFATLGHPEFIGQMGIVKFAYDTGDGCCQFEQGWYLDKLNFATDCACAADPDCSLQSGSCGAGKCDTTAHECTLTPVTVGAPCGNQTGDACRGPDSCDTYGFCNIHYEPKEAATCDFCTDGVGECLACGGGTCLNCPALQTFDTLPSTMGTATGAWGFYYNPPPSSPGVYVPFGMHNTVLGVDGSAVSPYYTGANVPVPHAVETSSYRTAPTVVPAALKFQSWHVDRGGQTGRDTKRIRVSTDMGTTWKTLVDCQGMNNTLAFCQQVQTRANDAWDDISIDTGALAGQTGIFEFSYDSLDAGQGWELGWYLDNINILRCGTY